jgi:transcriptional regulator with XRE-family HTH domain
MAKKSTNLSDDLRKAIVESGWQQKEIAEAAGIERALLCRFLAGRSGFSMNSLDRLAAVLGLRLVRTKGAKKGHRKGRQS